MLSEMHQAGKCPCGAIHYYGMALNMELEAYGIVFVTKRPGEPTSQEWAGLYYSAEAECRYEMEKLQAASGLLLDERGRAI